MCLDLRYWIPFDSDHPWTVQVKQSEKIERAIEISFLISGISCLIVAAFKLALILF